MPDVYKLVSLADLKAYIEDITDVDDTSHDALLTGIRDAVESLLEKQTNQQFSVAAPNLVETHDGTGTRILYARRPIANIDALQIKYGDAELPGNVVDLSISTDVRYRVGQRRIALRTYRFPTGYNNVVLTYDTEANQPAIAIQAVKEACTALYRRRGSEDARSEQVGNLTHVLLRNLDESIFWKKAVESLTVFPIG